MARSFKVKLEHFTYRKRKHVLLFLSIYFVVLLFLTWHYGGLWTDTDDVARVNGNNRNSPMNKNVLENIADSLEAELKVIANLRDMAQKRVLGLKKKELRDKGVTSKLDKLETDFEFVSNLAERANREVIDLIEKEKVNTFEVNLTIDGVQMKDVELPPFKEYGNDDDEGEHGKGLFIDPKSLKPDERTQMDKDFKINYFNTWVSNRIAVHRRLDDARPKRCRDQVFNLDTFPSCSIIIVFYNEAWTTLLRTIHSIIDRTPKEPLHEIILLDDGSDQDHLKVPLEAYLQPLKIVRLIRSTKRLGLITARNLGFTYAKGEIIIFLDSHIECFPGWLEPLVTPIVLDPKTVTFPVIPVINKSTFATGADDSMTLHVGTLQIHSLAFSWMPVNNTGLLHYNSPTMPGGLYAISRKWFQYLGAYDPQLRFWGGENLEISFKIWMCGGKILEAACSCVGHVFRTKSPLRREEYGNAIETNSVRVAEVWMDRFRHFFYEKFNYKIEPFGDISLQKRLRRGLNCKTFQWYLDNVNPQLKTEMDVRGVLAGQIFNNKTKQCLDLDESAYDVILAHCNPMKHTQVWLYRSDGYLSTYDRIMCFNSGLTMRHSAARHTPWAIAFDRDEKLRLVRKDTTMCLDIGSISTRQSVSLSPCSDSQTQKWTIQTRWELQEFHKARNASKILWT